MAEIASTSQADVQQYTIRNLYSDMVLRLSEMISPNRILAWQRLLTALDPLLPHGLHGNDITYIGQILEKLRAKGQIVPMKGSFGKLYDALLKIDIEAAEVVKETSVKIKALLSEGEPAAKRSKTGDAFQMKEINPKFKPMIETTKSTIRIEEKSYKFISTKSLQDACQKLMEKKIVIIQGNTGDGKSAIALELLRLLCHDEEEGQQKGYRQPLQLHDIKDLNLVAPKSQFVIFFDDIFGKNVVCREDVNEWKKREKEIIAKLCGNDSEANYLVITIRSGILNSLNGLEKAFTKENMVDLRHYKDENEKRKLLRLYEPKDKFVKWSDDEEKKIITLAPDIGFPQCCRLFQDTPSLQTERVKFFERPFHYFKLSLSELEDGKFYGLMYLFLNGGSIIEHDLDPSIKNIEENEEMKAAFAFDVVKVNPTRELKYKKEKKAEFVKESLECLLGWLVKKESTQKQGKQCSFYKFNHDSTEETVALLYGEKTPIGYIQNCPKKFLSYVTTTKNTPNKIAISSDDQTNAMYERTVKVFESLDPESYCYLSESEYLATLDVWTDNVFLQGFIGWLSGQNYDQNLCHLIKCALLNGACSTGSEDRVSYLLSVDVTPDEETPFSVVRGGGVQLLSEILKYDVIHTARAYESRSSHSSYNINVLHEACLFEREEMVTMLCDTFPHLVHDHDRWKQSTLHIVAMTGNCDIFQTVERTVLESLCRVEDVQHKCELEDGCVVHRSCVCGQFMSQLVDMLEGTVLYCSCKWGHMELSLELCKTYPTLTTAYNNGKTILHCSCEKGHRELSLELGKTYPALTTAVDNGGKTVLHRSCIEGHMELSLELGKTYPALTTTVDKYGTTILHYSCEKGHRELSLELCKLYPALTTAVDNDGKTILHYSCEGGRRELSLELCKLYPALTTAVDNDRWTVLHYSCRYGHRELSLELCKIYPALTTAVDNDGYHCLHYIARRTSDVNWFTECELHVKQYVETTRGKYDIRTILTDDGQSVVDLARNRTERERKYIEFYSNPLFDHLVKVFTE